MSLYHWRTSRGRHVLDELLREGMNPDGSVYGGAIISDGYEGYASWMRSLPEEQRPQWQACWAHVRRKFVEAARTSSDPEWSRKMVKLIIPLYRIERELRESKAPPPAVREKREAESRPVVEAFFAALQERTKQSENPPTNTLRRAINYALERRETLMTWLTAPYIPIDNNAVERAIRPLAVGRRNSLFIGSPQAGQRAAVLYTMVRECQRVKVDSEAWLTAVLKRLPDYRGEYLDLLPGMLELPESRQGSTSTKAWRPQPTERAPETMSASKSPRITHASYEKRNFHSAGSYFEGNNLAKYVSLRIMRASSFLMHNIVTYILRAMSGPTKALTTGESEVIVKSHAGILDMRQSRR